MTMLDGNRLRPLARTALALAVACLLPLGAAQARDRGPGGGDDDDDGSHALVVPAAACIEVAVAGLTAPATTAFQTGGAFGVQGTTVAQTATLRCPVTGADRSSSGSGSGYRFTAFHVSYLDSDGVPGVNANVAVTLVRTDLAAVDPTGFGFASSDVCTWSSSVNGNNFTQGGTTAIVPCAADLSTTGFFHFRVELSAQPSTVAGVTNRASLLGIELLDN